MMMKKKTILIFIFLILIILVVTIGIIVKNNFEKEMLELKQKNIEKTISTINKHYGKYVITSDKEKLYKLKGNEYVEYGEINERINIELGEMDIDEKTKYFYIPNLDLYIPYSKVLPSSEEKNSRYENYIPFNYNIVTNESTIFYDFSDNKVYSINKSFDFPVVVEDNERHGIIFDNKLLFIHNEDTKEIYVNNNTENNNKSKIRVLTYHAIYNPDKVICDTSICETLSEFESHLKYIRENNYFTLTLTELELYLDGKINIPEKSIVLTIDDGTLIDLDAIKLLEKYKTNATLFVVTSWVDITNLKSNYLDLESHTDNMHNQYECPGYGMQGGGILCLPEDQVLNDLKTSQEKLGGSKYFAYPFFDFNARAIKLLKEAGFHMAFIGQYDTDGYSYPKSTDKFKVRRKTIFNDISMDEFISYLK